MALRNLINKRVAEGRVRLGSISPDTSGYDCYIKPCVLADSLTLTFDFPAPLGSLPPPFETQEFDLGSPHLDFGLATVGGDADTLANNLNNTSWNSGLLFTFTRREYTMTLPPTEVDKCDNCVADTPKKACPIVTLTARQEPYEKYADGQDPIPNPDIAQRATIEATYFHYEPTKEAICLPKGTPAPHTPNCPYKSYEGTIDSTTSHRVNIPSRQVLSTIWSKLEHDCEEDGDTFSCQGPAASELIDRTNGYRAWELLSEIIKAEGGGVITDVESINNLDGDIMAKVVTKFLCKGNWYGTQTVPDNCGEGVEKLFETIGVCYSFTSDCVELCPECGEGSGGGGGGGVFTI